MAKDKIFANSIVCSDEMQMIEKIIFHYSATLVLRGEAVGMLRKQLISLLALYFKYGYNPETKKLALEVFKIKDSTLASLNKDLYDKGYLIVDPTKKTIKYLNPALQLLAEYVGESKDKPLVLVLKVSLNEM